MVKLINRIILKIKREYFVFYYKTKYSHINFEGIRFNGFPIFQFNGTTKLGNNLFFNSNINISHYYLGLNHPCIIDVWKNAYLEIGDNCGFSAVCINCANRIVIGKYVLFGFNVTIIDTDFHPIDYLERRVSIEGAMSRPIVIGDDVLIGANSIILKGATIGDRSIIGAGSVVTQNIPPDEIWAGNPARFIRSLIKEF